MGGDSGIARNAGFAFGVQMTGAVFTAGLTLFLVRALDPDGYGTLALAISVGGVALIVSDLGVSQATARYVAENRGDRSAAGALVGDALKLKLAISAAVSIALAALAGPIASGFGASDLEWPLRAIAIAVFAQSLMFMYSTFVALGRTDLNLRLAFAESFTETAATIALVLLGAGVTGAAFGRAVGYAVGGLATVILLARVFGLLHKGRRHRRVVPRRALAGYAGALAIVDGTFALFSQIDVLVIGAVLGPSAVGLFQAPMRLAPLLSYPGTAVAFGVGPRLARRKDRPPDVEGLETALRYLVLFQAALIAPIVVWAEPIVDLLLGEDYAESAEVLRALAPFIFLGGLSPVLSIGVNYLGVARSRIAIAVTALAVNFAIDVALVPEIGIVAGAIGTGVGYAIYTTGHFWICRRELGIGLRGPAIALVQAGSAACAMAAVLAAFGTSSLSPIAWLAGGASGTAAFVLVLILTGALTRQEGDAVTTAARRVAARFR